MSFLIIASAKGNTTLCEMLFNKGAVIDWQAKDGMNALVAAAMQQHPIVVKFLLDKGAKPDLRWDGITTLMIAAESGQAEIVKMLLDQGADPDLIWEGTTALMICLLYTSDAADE